MDSKWRLFFTLDLGLLTALSILAHFYPYFFFDPPITQFIQIFHPSWWNSLMINISVLGGGWFKIPVILAAFFLALIYRNYKDAFFILISSVGGFLLGELLKVLVLRPRPSLPSIHQLAIFPDRYSYPSGHVLMFVSFFGFILYLFITEKRNHILKDIGIYLLILLIVLIGLSRIYLGVHWFSDVVGGYLLGSVWLYLIVFFYKKIS